MLDFDLTREGVPPRDAATILMVRDGDAGLEVFCVERNKRSRFLGGAIVFPGGKVDAEDRDARWGHRATVPRTPSDATFGDAEALRAFTVAACRESLEEAALLPVVGARPLADADVRALRAAIAAKETTLEAFLDTRALRIDTAALLPFARWVTPTAESRRFDTRFFLAAAPPGQRGAHDELETMASFWARPADVVARFLAGELQLAPPTHRSLEILAAAGTVARAIDAALGACLAPICPRLVPQPAASGSEDTMALALPGDPEHPVTEARAPGCSRYVLRGDRWLPEHAPPR